MPTLPPDEPSRRKALDRIAPKVVSPEPDQKAKAEELDLENQRRKLENVGLSQDIKERKKYALLFFILACFWVCAIMVILFLQGFGSFWWGNMPFKLETQVILTAIGSTTANIIGVLFVVANYLFPKHKAP